MTRTIPDPSELDAHPVGTTILDAMGDVVALVEREGRKIAVAQGFEDPPTLLSDSCFPAELLHDPSATVLVVSDAAVEAARLAFYGPIEASTAVGAEAHGENLLRRFRAALSAALPLLAAVPSATREEVRDEIAGHPIGSGYYATSVGVDEASEIADALLARFAITPRTDR